jgi:putative solute:sodium symporter small subunit
MSAEKILRNRALYWRRTRRLTAALLSTWFLTTFVFIFFAREFSALTILGWPVSFYMAGQGLTVLYLLIIAVYMRRMDKLDRLLDNETDDAE